MASARSRGFGRTSIGRDGREEREWRESGKLKVESR